MKRSSTWITKATAAAALGGGLGGVAHATILSAGGFPNSVLTGSASCVIANTGTRDVTVDWTMSDGPSAVVLAQETVGSSIPGRASRRWPFPSPSSRGPAPALSTSARKPSRAAFTYDNGSSVTVIPAQK